MMRRIFWSALKRAPTFSIRGRLAQLERSQPRLIDRAAWFVACEMIEGAYLEFGVYRGGAFEAAYHATKNAFARRIAQTAGEASHDQQARRQEIFESMRFVALDGFQGLPELAGPDRGSADFRAGQYRASEAHFRQCIASGGVPLDRVITVPGWFSDTSNSETWAKIGVEKAAIIWIDCDLYSSARDALSGVTGLLQDGTVIIFDDWFAFRGNPRRGEQRAFAEWRATVTDFDFVEFHQEGVWRKSFIAAALNPDEA